MKRNIQSTRSPLLTSILAGIASAGFTAAALAAGVGVGVGASVGAGAQVTAPGQAQAGGRADANMSTTGSAHTNAQWRDDAVRGADRAVERMNGAGEATTELEATSKADASAKRAPAQ